MLKVQEKRGEARAAVLPGMPCRGVEGMEEAAHGKTGEPAGMTPGTMDRLGVIEQHDLSEQEMIAKAKRAMWMLKRHRSDFAKVTAGRIRMLERFIANPRRNSPGMMKIILKPFDGL